MAQPELIQGDPPRWLSVPIRHGEEAVGILAADFAAPTPQAAADHARLLTIAAGLIAADLQSRRLGRIDRPDSSADAPAPETPRHPPGTLKARVKMLERELVIDALRAHRGSVALAARELGITPRMVRYKIDELAIDHKRFSPKRRAN
jgi:DNA-binding NtrC family response regulator